MVEPVPKLLLGLLTGILFGVLLQKGRVAKFHVIVGQFLLKDWTVVRIMGTAVVVGAIGIYAMLPTELASLHIKPLQWGGVLLGGICFGVGMAVLGYCPGTGVAACGEGRRDAMIGVLGGLFGAGLFVVFYSNLKPIQSWGESGSPTLPSLTQTTPWLWIALFAIAVVVAFQFLGPRGGDKPGLPTSEPRIPTHSGT